jgi:uncharacterized membrane protein YGL010W
MKSLAEQMYVYASYHRHPGNKAFHFIGVPMLTLAILIPMAMLGITLADIPVTLASLFVLGVLIYYLRLDIPLAIAMLLFIVPVLLLAHWIVALGATIAWSTFGALFVVGWIIQLAGHGIEGRRPALTDNLFQVIVAPIFLMAEVFFAAGAKKGLQQEVEQMLARRGLHGKELPPHHTPTG